MCLVLSIFYGASLVHHNDISGGILVSYSLIALQVAPLPPGFPRLLPSSPRDLHLVASKCMLAADTDC
jgi:hypothetical protein